VGTHPGLKHGDTMYGISHDTRHMGRNFHCVRQPAGGRFLMAPRMRDLMVLNLRSPGLCQWQKPPNHFSNDDRDVPNPVAQPCAPTSGWPPPARGRVVGQRLLLNKGGDRVLNCKM